MKQYVIDELRHQDYKKIKKYFDESFSESQYRGIYWLPIDEKLLNRTQAAHIQCRPFYFALDLSPDRLCCEFLVRTKQRVRCDCMTYADERQRNWVMETIDAVFEKLEIKT